MSDASKTPNVDTLIADARHGGDCGCEGCKPLKFAHLHQHTAYSLLDGAARIKDLMAWVKEVSPENPTVAMTDHGNMHGAVEFYKTAVGMGVKPILGFEAYVTAGSRFEKRRPSSKLDGGYFHLTLLAKNFKGYQNLCKLNSRGWLEGFYMKPRVDHELLREYSEGVIAMSGCLGAQIPRNLLDVGLEAGEEVLRQYLDIYGDDFFIELQNHVPENAGEMDPSLRELAEQQTRLNPMLKELANRYGLGMVATNDGHYVKRDDAKAHEALLAIQTKTTLSDPNRFRFPCDEFYVKTPEEMARAIPESEYGGALANSVTVADMCDVELPIGAKRVYQMPELPIPAGRTLAEQLRVQTYEGLLERYEVVTEDLYRRYLGMTDLDVPEALEDVLDKLATAGELCQRKAREAGTKYVSYAHLGKLKQAGGVEEEALTILERAEYELGVIISMGFPDYFLIVADFINWAKDQGIAVGPGRGSGAGSIVAYATRITDIDPLEFDLLFERFLNPDRVSMPDFDVDFSDSRRMEVVDYVRRKYGEEKVAQIATFGTMASKAAIRDAARVLEAPYAEADAVSKLIPVVFGRSVPITRAMEEVSEIRGLYEAGAKEFVDVAMSLEGLTRHASVHAAGVIIAREPVQELAPVFRSGDGPIVCQYDMGSVEELGFLKMDFLGLRTLTFIETAVRIVKASRGVDLDPDDFPKDDEKTFELLSRGEAAGVFQFEGPGMVDTLKKLKPRRIQDLIAVSALYRPGPMENIPTYIRRHHGQEEVDYSQFPASKQYLESILAETYGIPVYQEQIMQIAQAVAGYTLGEADLLRRAMGKKKVEEMLKQRAVFLEGAKKNGIPAGEAGAIFDLLEKFANYGFNKCVWEGTLVPLGDGQLVTVASLYRNFKDREIVSVGGDFSLRREPIAEVLENGVKPVYKLTTSLGKEVTATGNHPFLTLDGWKNLEELKVGERIAAPARLPTEGKTVWGTHELVLLGWTLAEGNTCHPCGVYLYSNDEVATQDMVKAASQFSNTAPTVKLRPERHNTYDVYLGTGRRGPASGGRSGARRWLEGLGVVGQSATQKAFPPPVFSLTNACLAVILGRYWSGDGFVSGGSNLTPYAATSSRTMAKGLQHLLLRFGIVSRVTEKRFAYREGRTGYTVHVLGRRSIEAFLKHIAPHIVGKRTQLECLREYLEHTPPDRESVDTLPPEVKRWVQEAKEASGLTWREVEVKSGVCVKELYGNLHARKKGFRRETVRKLASFFGSEKLRRACSEDLFWERVERIDYAGEAMTYDLTVEDTHNFVADDLIVHNSHSAAYGALSYQTAYLKAHYPLEFAAALLTVERNNSDKVAEYVTDTRRLGIEVLPPDINESRSDFTPVDGVVRFGLYGIKNVGDAAVEHILEARERGGRFKDLYDFCKRVDSSTVNKRALEHLVKAGAFDKLGERSTLLANLEAAMKWGAAQREQASAGQFSLFGADETRPPELRSAEKHSKLELLKFEKEALGLYISDHPMNSYPGLAAAASCPVAALEGWYGGQKGALMEGGLGAQRLRVALAGILQNVVKKPTKKGTMMAHFELADESGSVKAMAFSRVYEEIAEKLKEDAPVVLVAEVSEDAGSLRLVAERLIRWEEREGLPEVAIAEFNLSDVDETLLTDLRSRVDEFAGVTPLHLKVRSPRGVATYSTDGIRIDRERLTDLQATCPWLRTALTIDREGLLRAAPGNRFGKPKEEGGGFKAVEVPF